MQNSLYFCDSNIWLYRFLLDPDSDRTEEIKVSQLLAITNPFQ
jgi:predicted nucleic acid-binding protein